MCADKTRRALATAAHPRWTALLLSLAAVSLTAATCAKESAPVPEKKDEVAAKPVEVAPAPDDPATGGGGEAGDVAKTLSGIPKMDFSTLSPAAQKELATVLNDEFCYCGCPHTLGACLKAHPNCRHARRMAVLAAAEAAGGVSAVETIVALSKYYSSFAARRFTPTVDPRQCMGPADAKVTLVEYSDFECPFCAAARPLLESFVKESGKVRFCWAAYPLTNHPNAMPAANAALFARDHGKFWEMHDALFDNQNSLSPEFIISLGTRMGLDAGALQKAMSSGAYNTELNASKDAARKNGVESTPSIFINGRQHRLSIDKETLTHAVDDELEWSANKGWAPDPG